MKPMLASDAVVEKLRYPLLASPKLDGLRGLVHDGKLLSRSLKLIPNKHVQQTFGIDMLNGIDGELIFGPPNAPDVYRRSSSAIMGHAGTPHVTFWVFDKFDKLDMKYYQRRALAQGVVESVTVNGGTLRLLEQKQIHDLEQLRQYEDACLERGFEGLILRDPESFYKYGRSSAKEGILLKLKRFSDGEAEVIDFEEQMHNTNEATTNELGRTKRSSAKAGLKGKDTLGALVCRCLESGVTFRIGTGMDDAERQHVWDNAPKFKGKIVKYKSFKIGVKDAPRHPVFLGWRDKRDMS